MSHELRTTKETVLTVYPADPKDAVRCRDLVEALQSVPNGAMPVAGSFGDKYMTIVFKQLEPS